MSLMTGADVHSAGVRTEAVTHLKQVDAPGSKLCCILLLVTQASSILCTGLAARVCVDAQLQACGAHSAEGGAAVPERCGQLHTGYLYKGFTFTMHVVGERSDTRRKARRVVCDGPRDRPLAHSPAVCARQCAALPRQVTVAAAALLAVSSCAGASCAAHRQSRRNYTSPPLGHC